jgi:hypothetical protein
MVGIGVNDALFGKVDLLEAAPVFVVALLCAGPVAVSLRCVVWAVSFVLIAVVELYVWNVSSRPTAVVKPNIDIDTDRSTSPRPLAQHA